VKATVGGLNGYSFGRVRSRLKVPPWYGQWVGRGIVERGLKGGVDVMLMYKMNR